MNNFLTTEHEQNLSPVKITTLFNGTIAQRIAALKKRRGLQYDQDIIRLATALYLEAEEKK